MSKIIGIVLVILTCNTLCSLGYWPNGHGESVSPELKREIENSGIPCRKLFIDKLGVYHFDFTGTAITNLLVVKDVVFPAICRDFVLREQRHGAGSTGMLNASGSRGVLSMGKSSAKGPELWLYFIDTAIQDISPLQGLPVVGLDLRDTKVRDISPLKGMPIRELNINSTRISDITSLKGMPLQWLDIGNTPVKDISSLAGLPLQFVSFLNTSVTNVSPLDGMVVVLIAKGGVAYRKTGSVTSPHSANGKNCGFRTKVTTHFGNKLPVISE